MPGGIGSGGIVDIPFPGNGPVGYVLGKTNAADYAFDWVPPGGGGGGVASVSAGTTQATGPQIIFSNSPTVTFGANGNTITASAAGGGGAGAALSAGTQSVATGTVSFANSNGITFGMSGSSQITASHNGLTTQTVQTQGSVAVQGSTGAISFANSNGISFGANASTITATVRTDYASSDVTSGRAGTGSGFSGTNVSGTMTVNTNGVSIQLSVANPGGGAAFTNGVSGGNTSGTSGTVSNRLVLAGGNNVTLSASTDAGGMSVTISGANAGGAQTGISGVQVSNTTYTSGTITFQNANGISFGSSGANGISASYTVPTVPTSYVSNVNGSSGAISIAVGSSLSSSQAGSSITIGLATNITTALQSTGNYLTIQSNQAFSAAGGSSAFQTLSFADSQGVSFSNSNGSIVATVKTDYAASNVTSGRAGTSSGFSGTNISASITHDTNGLALQLSVANPGGGGGGIANSAGTQIATSGTVVFSNSNNVSFGMSNSSVVTASFGQTNQSVGIYASSNTTGQSSSSTFDARSLSMVAYGLVSIGHSNGSILVSSPNIVDFTQLSVGVSTGGNTSNNSGMVTGQLVLAGGPNITLSGSTNGGSMTVSISGGAGGGGGGGVGVGISSMGNTAGTSGTVTTGNVVLVGSGPISLSQSSSGSNATISINGPAVSSLSATGIVSISTNGSTISIGAPAQSIVVSAGTTSGSVNSLSFVNSNQVSFGLAAGAITASIPRDLASWFEPEIYGGTTSQAQANGTVYFRPFAVANELSFFRAQMLGIVTTQGTTTMSISGSVSAGNATSGSGSWGQSGTLQLFSRVSTGTDANSSRIISFYSNSYSYSIGLSNSVSWSTNASSATVSFTTAGQVGYIANIDSAGGITASSFSTTGSGSFSSSSTNVNSFSSSFAMTFASQVMSQVRPINVPFATSLSVGEYWMGHRQSSQTGSTNYSLQARVQLAPGMVYYTTNTTGYAEIGSTVTIASNNIRQGWGSYSASSNTSTTIALSAISNMSQYALYFNLRALSK